MYTYIEAGKILKVSKHTIYHWVQMGRCKPDMMTQEGYKAFSEKEFERMKQAKILADEKKAQVAKNKLLKRDVKLDERKKYGPKKSYKMVKCPLCHNMHNTEVDKMGVPYQKRCNPCKEYVKTMRYNINTKTI